MGVVTTAQWMAIKHRETLTKIKLEVEERLLLITGYRTAAEAADETMVAVPYVENQKAALEYAVTGLWNIHDAVEQALKRKPLDKKKRKSNYVPVAFDRRTIKMPKRG